MLRRPAAEKRQGTKSREVGYWLAANAIGISISAPYSFAVGTPTRRMYQRKRLTTTVTFYLELETTQASEIFTDIVRQKLNFGRTPARP
jgi:hypothetical protein